jgi:hypothetical protein
LSPARLANEIGKAKDRSQKAQDQRGKAPSTKYEVQSTKYKVQSAKYKTPVTVRSLLVSMSVGSSPVNKQGFQEQEDKKRDEEIWKD